jgi:predicted phage tail protein
VGDAPRSADELQLGFGPAQAVRIVPVVSGSKSGLKMLLTGILLFYGAPFLAGSLGAGTALGASVATYGAKIGSAMMLGGVIQLLSPQRKMGTEARTENAPSYAFSGAVNTTQQGYPVPLVFGRVVTGGAAISAGLSADELAPAAAPTPAPAPPARPAEQPLNPLPDDQIP